MLFVPEQDRPHFIRSKKMIEKQIVKIKKLREDAIIPSYATPFSAGADLCACIDFEKISFNPKETKLIPTGLSVEIPEGFAGFIYARSSVASKRGLAPANKVGVIDSDYRGEIMVALHNQSDSVQEIENRERIAQLVIAPYIKAEFTECDSLEESVRGEGGFGSTGRKG